jgi:hypothetical protein
MVVLEIVMRLGDPDISEGQGVAVLDALMAETRQFRARIGEDR